MKRFARLGATAAGGAVVAQGLPTALALRPVRMVTNKRLAGVGSPGHVALTFDDGPDPASTPLFLELLEREGVRATFFLLGSMLVRNPSLGEELVDAGHEVAVHGWEHRPLVVRGPVATASDIARARDLIGEVTGRPVSYYRPPYGVGTTAAYAAAHRLGLRPLLWTAWGRDWAAKATGDSVLRIVTRQLRGGGTILLHDSDCTSAPGSWKATIDALPRLLDHCRANGWEIGPVSEHG